MRKEILLIAILMIVGCTKKEGAVVAGVSAPQGTVAASSGAVSVVNTAGAPAEPNKTCPASELCPEFARSLSACGADNRSAECDKLVELFKKLAGRYDCQRSFDHVPGRAFRPVPAVWLCDQMVDRSYGYPRPYEKAVGVIYKLDSQKAREFFASEELRSTMDGEVAETYGALSRNAAEKINK